MSIEEAEYILNEAVITHPSINSYTYISAEEINEAIEQILEEKLKNEKRIKELEECIVQEKIKLEEIMRENDLEKKQYPSYTQKNNKKYLKKLIKYVKKIVKTPFWLEN